MTGSRLSIVKSLYENCAGHVKHGRILKRDPIDRETGKCLRGLLWCVIGLREGSSSSSRVVILCLSSLAHILWIFIYSGATGASWGSNCTKDERGHRPQPTFLENAEEGPNAVGILSS